MTLEANATTLLRLLHATAAAATAGAFAADMTGLNILGQAALAKELLEIEAAGDRARAEAWFAKYDKMPAELRTALDGIKDVPVDVDPLIPFAEGVR